ncbi:MAG TPA: alkaline phosphatase family protein [Chthoniobacterales bacterium]|nr:alkaline phosphatase family protein [Chthoniobacterales bacterium]
MSNKIPLPRLVLSGAVALSSLATLSPAMADQGTFLPSGLIITPTAAPKTTYEPLNPDLSKFPNFVAGGALSTVKSPDGKTLLVLTGGHNSLTVDPKTSITNEYIFVFDISGGKPVKKQVLEVPNAFVGIAFDPTGQTFYVGGSGDDDIHSFTIQNGQWAESGTPIKLGHNTFNPDGSLKTGAVALFPGDLPGVTGGIELTQDGKTLVVANYSNESISFIDVKSRTVVKEIDLRPGKINKADAGKPGGEYPFWVTVKGNNTAYVSSARDREIVVVDFTTITAPKVVTRIEVAGNPLKTILDKTQSYLYVTEDNSDLVDIITTKDNALFQSVIASAPDKLEFDNVLTYRGSAPNSAALSADGSTLYVTLGGTNAISVITGVPFHPEVIGLIPAGFQPNAITLSDDGKYAYVADGKGVTGPNPGLTYFNQKDPNQYVEELQKSYLQSFPIPSEQELGKLTAQVAKNNGFTAKLTSEEANVIHTLQRKIKHVIYVVKENRTYDQVLGDLDRGNGDPALVDFGEAITPNYHAIARQFVDLDNFYNSGDVSGDGHAWSFAGRENDLSTISIPQNYSSRGPAYDTEGQNRDVNVGFGTQKERQKFNPDSPSDPDILPGTADVGAVDGPGDDDVQQGYIWDAVKRAGKTFRNYGYHCDQAEYFLPKGATPLERDPFSKKLRVGFPSRVALIDTTDPYFRSFDTAFPDFWREKEWEREFDGYVKKGNLPALSMVRLMEDHMGSFGSAIDGVNTPEIQQADNDYAVAKLIEKVANSPYKSDTLIFILEDDSQDGADHVDSHRSVGYVVGPYVKHGAVISENYTTVNMLRTIEDILNVDHVDILTASEKPMTKVFDLNQSEWTFDAVPSIYLYNTQLPLPPRFAKNKTVPKPTHDSVYWADKTKNFDFSREDRVDPDKFNRIVWEGLHGSKPYPTVRSGLDLRRNRSLLLKKAHLAGN